MSTSNTPNSSRWGYDTSHSFFEEDENFDAAVVAAAEKAEADVAAREMAEGGRAAEEAAEAKAATEAAAEAEAKAAAEAAAEAEAKAAVEAKSTAEAEAEANKTVRMLIGVRYVLNFGGCTCFGQVKAQSKAVGDAAIDAASKQRKSQRKVKAHLKAFETLVKVGGVLFFSFHYAAEFPHVRLTQEGSIIRWKGLNSHEPGKWTRVEVIFVKKENKTV
jgi:chemotaxis protein histidine kinase CheA